MLGEEVCWDAILSFCDEVIAAKERAVREKRGEVPLPDASQRARPRAQRWRRHLAAHLRA
jgi:hypothetical protein